MLTIIILLAILGITCHLAVQALVFSWHDDRILENMHRLAWLSVFGDVLVIVALIAAIAVLVGNN